MNLDGLDEADCREDSLFVVVDHAVMDRAAHSAVWASPRYGSTVGRTAGNKTASGRMLDPVPKLNNGGAGSCYWLSCGYCR